MNATQRALARSDAAVVKFVSRAGDLANALTSVRRVVPKSPSLAVYSGVRMTVKSGTLQLTGSDEGTTTIVATVPATDLAPGDKVINPKPLGAYLATLNPAVEVAVSAGSMPELVAQPEGSSPYRFRLMEATYPNVSQGPSQTIPVDFTDLGRALRAVRSAAGTNAAGVKQVQVVSDERGLRLHATDNFRLARAVVPGAGFGTFTGLLPLRVLDQLAEAGINRAAVDRRGDFLYAFGPDTAFVVQRSAEQFPTVESVLDNEPRSSVEVDAAELASCIRRLEAVSDGRPATVSIDGDSITLTINDTSAGAGAERVELDRPSASAMTFNVNLEYLRDVLTAHSTDVVTLGWTAPTLPIMLTSAGTVDVTTVTALATD